MQDTTTSLLNNHIKHEIHLNECFNEGISANLGLKQKYSYVTSQGSFIPLTAKNQSRTHSWINVDLLNFTQLYGMRKQVLFFEGRDYLPLSVGTTIYYINSKLDEVRMKKDYIMHHFASMSRSVERIKYDEYHSPFCRIKERSFFDDETIKRVNLGTARRIKEQYDKKNKEM